MPETHFFEQQDGSKIAYKILKSENAKNEVPLVLIIGMGCTKDFYFGFDEELAKDQQVIVFDNRGMGESTVTSCNDPITIELMAQDTIALIKHLGIKKFNLFGVDMGALIAFAAALNIPSDSKIEKLVTINCAPRIDTSSLAYQGFEKHYNLETITSPKTIQEQKDELINAEYAKDSSSSKYLLEHPNKLDKVAEIIFNTIPGRPFEMTKRQWEAIKAHDPLPRLKEIKVPTLVIHGENNEFVPIKNADLIVQEIPNSKLYKVPNVGRGIFLVAPETANVVSEFLNN